MVPIEGQGGVWEWINEIDPLDGVADLKPASTVFKGQRAASIGQWDIVSMVLKLDPNRLVLKIGLLIALIRDRDGLCF